MLNEGWDKMVKASTGGGNRWKEMELCVAPGEMGRRNEAFTVCDMLQRVVMPCAVKERRENEDIMGKWMGMVGSIYCVGESCTPRSSITCQESGQSAFRDDITNSGASWNTNLSSCLGLPLWSAYSFYLRITCQMVLFKQRW